MDSRFQLILATTGRATTESSNLRRISTQKLQKQLVIKLIKYTDLIFLYEGVFQEMIKNIIFDDNNEEYPFFSLFESLLRLLILLRSTDKRSSMQHQQLCKSAWGPARNECWRLRKIFTSLSLLDEIEKLMSTYRKTQKRRDSSSKRFFSRPFWGAVTFS